MLTFEKNWLLWKTRKSFQYAALVGFAEKSGLEYGIPHRNQNEIDVGDYKIALELNDYFNLSCKDSSTVIPTNALIENEQLTEPIQFPMRQRFMVISSPKISFHM